MSFGKGNFEEAAEIDEVGLVRPAEVNHRRVCGKATMVVSVKSVAMAKAEQN